MVEAHRALDAYLGNREVAPLQRVRGFFEAIREMYRQQGYLGCLLGGLGQELSGVNDVFRRRIESCFSEIARRIASCLEEAIQCGDLPQGTDAQRMANLLVNSWEGAALRTRLLRDPEPLQSMLDFCFRTAGAGPTFSLA
jgi:TetR/AcrR family transcriptional regulator, transcriptional repressor for nem operon